MLDFSLSWARDQIGDGSFGNTSYSKIESKKADLIARVYILPYNVGKSLPDWAFFVF